MAKFSNRDKLLTDGLRVMHKQGYAGTSVRDIVQAAGVPQGSFTNHFASKESYALEILERYFAEAGALIRGTLLDDTKPPLHRLEAYIDANADQLDANDLRAGCLLGNFAAEASNAGETIRKRLVEIFGEIRGAVAQCLKAAVETGELPRDFKCDRTAGFIVASLQGAILLAKAERSTAPVERFRKILFSKVLR